VVAAERDELTADYRFVIRPNRSLSWRGALCCFGLIAAVSLAIALFFGFMGAWPILPFAGAELLGLGTALYVCACRARDCEVVSIQGATVRIEKGRSRPVETSELPRHWARVTLESSPLRSHPSRLTIRSHGRAVEIGGCLSEEERMNLARELSGVVGACAAHGASPA
jgi:uncharacterized membrane protein